MTQLDRSLAVTQFDIPGPAEQRRHPRHMFIDGGVLRLAVRPEFRGRRALMIDVSASGIGFLLEDALPADTVLVFELQGPEGGGGVNRIARVRHCRPHVTPPDAPWLPPAPVVSKFFRRLFGANEPQLLKHAWFVGCEFDLPLTEGEIRQLLEQTATVRATA